MKRSASGFFLSVLFLLLTGCATPIPNNVDNICSIFRQYPNWYWATQDVSIRWNIPIPVQMAIMHQESRYNSVARPPRTKLLWIIPWKRPSSSYGYTQALDSTWRLYKKSTGKFLASRDNFKDAVDFIGWYSNTAYKRARIPKTDAYKLYLAYHEGVGGYLKGTYRRKQWLVNVAKKVQRQAYRYKVQLSHCQSSLGKKPWYQIW